MKRSVPVILMLFFCCAICAQEAINIDAGRSPGLHTTIKGLTIGDRLPDLPIGHFVNGAVKKATTASYNNRLLLLDFMDTYCSSCLGALPGLDKLQQEFGSRIQIFPVTWQKESAISKWLNNPAGYAELKQLKLPWIVADSVLSAHFPHKFVSHIAWIYKGEVIGITTKEYVTYANIAFVLAGNKNNWPVKADQFYFDAHKPIFNMADSTAYNTESRFSGYSGITGYRDGIDYKGGIAYDSLLRRTSFYNFSVTDAYIALWSKFITPPLFLLKHPGRIILEVKNRSQYIYDSSKSYVYTWNRANKFCYEMVTPARMEEQERTLAVIGDLNRRFELNTRLEKRTVRCLVITNAGNGAKPDTTAVPGATKIALGALTFWALDRFMKYPPAIDESGYEGFIYLRDFKTPEELRTQLLENGFDIIEADREIEVLVITEKQ
jgi:thiol-disulfide isomerase/thioredoxin